MAHLIIVDEVPPVLTYRDSSTNDTNGTHTHSGLSFGPANSSRALIALFTTNVYAVSSVSSVSIGGVSATLVVRQISGGMSSEIWIAAVPSGTSGSVVLVGPSGGTQWDSGLGVYSVTDLIGLTATDTDTGGGSGINPVSTSVDVQPLGILVSVGGNNINSSNITWTNATRDYFLSYTNASSGASFTAAAGTTRTLSTSFSGSQRSVVATAAFR